MKNTRVFVTILLALSLALLASCGKPAAASYNTYADLDGKTLGMVEMPVVLSLERVNEMLGANFAHITTYPTYNEALMALKSGRVDAINVAKPQADYTIKTDSSYKYIVGGGKTETRISMLTTTADAELLDQINAAIKALKDSGELAALNENYIDNVSIEEVALPAEIEGAQTIRVGVTGDIPPFDYLSAEGNPSGYNVALMGAIAEHAGFNIEFVTVPFSTKFSALLSDRIDVFFFHGGILAHDSIAATDVYYENLGAGLLVNANA